MPSRVLADSEDEDGDIISPFKSTDRSQESHNRTATSLAAQSTGSTERLNAQIRRAESDLTSDNMATIAHRSQASPTSGLKRRHTEVSAHGRAVETPQVKRLKSSSNNTSSSGLLSQPLKQASTMSSHVRPQTTMYVPPASFSESQEDMMMFGQSGETVPFNTAEHQTARDLARGRHARSELPTHTELPLLEPRSSSVLMTASQLYQSPVVDDHAEDEVVTGEEKQQSAGEAAADEPLHTDARSTARSPANTDIHLSEAQATDPSAPVVSSRTSRTRNKAETPPVETTADPISSQTAIGLPKEQYVPRPSKRRAKPAAEIPDINDVDPNKVGPVSKAKKTSKYTKATKASKSADLARDEVPESTEQHSSNTIVVIQRPNKSKTIKDESKAPAPAAAHVEDDDDELASPHNLVRSTSTASNKLDQVRGKQSKQQQAIATSVEEQAVDEPEIKSTALKEVKNESSGRLKRKKSMVVDPDADEIVINNRDTKSQSRKSSATHTVKNRSSPRLDPAEKTAEQEVEAEQPDESIVIDDPTEISAPEILTSSPPEPPVASEAVALATVKTVVTKAVAEPKAIRTPSSALQPAAPMRVGLSKRNRIPSLLKIVRPMKKT